MWDGKAFLMQDDVDFILIDAPEPPEAREESFKSAITSTAKYIACHDIFRATEQRFIKKYLTNYKLVTQLEPTNGGKGLRGLAIYEKI